MPNEQQEQQRTLPSTVEEWIASYHEPHGVITRFVREQIKDDGNSTPVDDEDKQIVTEMIERVLPHFDMLISELRDAERSPGSCAAAADLLCGIMLSRVIRLTVDNPLKYVGMSRRHCRGIEEALKVMMMIATNDDMHALVGTADTEEGMKRFKELMLDAVS